MTVTKFYVYLVINNIPEAFSSIGSALPPILLLMFLHRVAFQPQPFCPPVREEGG